MAESKYSRKPRTSSEESQAPKRDPFRCAAAGCCLRAGYYPGQMGITDHANGYCLFHMRAQSMDRDDGSVSDRLQARIELVRQFERLRDAPLDGRGPAGKLRARMMDYSQTPPKMIPAVYPEQMPIRDDEHHHEWVDRARDYLLTLIVEKAEPKRGAA